MLTSPDLCRPLLDQLPLGIVVVDQECRITLWNRFMALHSRRAAEDVLGRCLFETFPELPERWLRKKLSNVFRLGNFSFSSWEQRPFLFAFPHHRPVTAALDHMRQDSTFIPLRDADGQVRHVCICVSDVTDSSLFQEALRETSMRDGLTSVANRTHFDEILAREISRVARYGGDLSLILLDLDHFKQVNDTFGHLAGDEVLRDTARRLAHNVRTSDLVARFGGEEFAVVLPSTPASGAGVLAERLRSQLAAWPVVYEGKSIAITGSFGLAEWSAGMQVEELVLAADRALYRSKLEGRDRVSSTG